MGEIEERRKKGRPSKADLARRAAADIRRSSRRRNVRYGLDLVDDYEEDEEREERSRREKIRRLSNAPPESDDDEVASEIEEETEVRERKAGLSDADSVPGTPPDLPMWFPLPDKETLELVLDMLQKKDTYSVFAEPVDPDELSDYHDVIEHPMDFATVRKKLGKGSYSTLEQFESDVLLICSNAMQYNAADTIYYKQAFSIQELAKQKFQRLRFGAEHYEKELQSEQKPTSNSLGTNKQIKNPITQIAPETAASDLSSGATFAASGDLQLGSAAKASGFERLSNFDESVDGTASQSDNNLDKAEDLPSGRDHIPRFGRKPLVHDDNRRATYNIFAHPGSQPESAFLTFDGEIKQLVAVGLHAEHSYGRSLARFAAMLGPVAWNIASKRIEKALPPGFKFDRGWVGDYEPISKPVLVMQKCSQGVTVFCKELNASSNPNEDENFFKTAESIHKNPIVAPTSEGKSAKFGAAVNTTVSPMSYSVPSKPQPLREEMLDVKPNITASVSYQVQCPRAKNIQSEKKVKQRVELNSPPFPAGRIPHAFSSPKQIPNGTNMSGSKSMEPLSRDKNHPESVPLEQPQSNGFVEVVNRESPSNNFDINTPIYNDQFHTNMPANFSPHVHDQALTDPVQLMRRLTENAQKQNKSIYSSTTEKPLVPSSSKEHPRSTSSAAARAWMSVGTGSPKSVSENTSVHNGNQIFVNSFHSPTQVSRFRNDFPVSGMQFHPMSSNYDVQRFTAPQFQTGNDAQFQNQSPMVFPQLVTTDLPRFQMRSSPRQGQHLQRQQGQKQETTIPPDLNLVFQSSGSPGRQSSGLQVDSQQPDLALQL